MTINRLSLRSRFTTKAAAFLMAAVTFPFMPLLTETAFAQTAPTLGTVQSFAVLGASTTTNTGPSVITGDLGVSPGTAITGFPPGVVVGGAIHAADAVALQAQADATNAYGVLAGEACNTTYGVPTDLGGRTLVPGVYCFSSSAAITGALTLNAGGDPNALFIFKVASTLITASDSSVVLINGADQCKVYWQVGSSATLGTRTSFVGTVIALASISLNTNATMAGRALALNGAVTLDSNVVSVPSCSAPPVNAPPTLSESFSTPTITAGGTSILTLTLSNPDNTAANIIEPFTDSLPSGLAVTGVASTTSGGTVNAIPGGSSITLTGGSIPANGSVTLIVDVTASAPGTYTNSLASGALQTSNGNSVSPAVASLTVNAASTPTYVAPTLGKSFNPANVSYGGLSNLILTLSNSNPVIDMMTAPLTDHLPAGMTVSGVARTTCGGTINAPTGSSAVTLSGASIPPNGSCIVSVAVSTDCACTYYNSLSTGSLVTDNGSNASPAMATLSVTKAPAGGVPTVSKFFYPTEVKQGVATTLTITLNNPNASPAVLTAPLTDHLPTGMLVSGLPTSSSSNTCGGTLSANKGSSYVTLSGGQIPVNSSCKVTVFVSAAQSGTYVNSLPVGILKTSKGNSPSMANATLIVSSSAGEGTQLSKAFSPSTISNDGTSTLYITLKNPHSTAARLTAPLIDFMPNHMVVYGSASNTCGGAMIATRGSSKVTLTGGSIPANGSCQVKVLVTAPCNTYFNYLPAGALQTTNGNNQEPNGATLTVTPN